MQSQKIHSLVQASGKLLRFIIFGSYITAKKEPNDVDIILIMTDDFVYETCDQETIGLFSHEEAAHQFGASVFWTRPSLVFGETLDQFVQHWQIKRDLSRRGIVEVVA